VPDAKPRLRYFDCRSRGQALRFALADAAPDFEDVRIPIAELAAFRRDAERPEIGGPFGSLPWLDWGGTRVAQTLAIAGFLARELDAEAGASSAEQAYRAMVTSAAHLDMQAPYSALLWLPAECPDERLLSGTRQLLRHLETKARQLESLLRERGLCFAGASPGVADFFVYESLSRACDVFGSAFRRVLDGLPALHALFDAVEARPRVAAARAAMPVCVTASPSEPLLRERIRALLSAP
jgi:glutathione S-transferase